MKKRFFLTSILTITVCLGLIAGSTFALFESEQSTNIVVSAGHIDVSASITDKSLNVEGMAYGTASYDAETNTLSVTNLVPGDSISFDMGLTNASNIPLKYTISVEDSSKTGASAQNETTTPTVNLADALQVKVTARIKHAAETGEATTEGYEDREIISQIGEGCTFETSDKTDMIQNLKVEIIFPAGNDQINYNSYENTKAELAIVVKAVQKTETETETETSAS